MQREVYKLVGENKYTKVKCLEIHGLFQTSNPTI